MKFAHPIWLLVGVLASLALWWRYRRFDRKQTSLLAAFVSPRLAQSLTRSVSPGRRRFKRALFVVATACLFIALARPQAGFHWEKTHRKGREILFAVDTSKSMLAQDVKPNRITRAKLAVEDLLGKLNGDGVGLVAFAGEAFLQCPVTLDYEAFQESVEALDTQIIPRGGTDIAAAIHEAQSAFKTRANSDKILILITDGEDLRAEGTAAAKAAAKDGVKIFTVGVGSANGELIPVPFEDGGTKFVKDASGRLVKSRLDEATLRQIAEATGGMYQPLGQQGQGLVTILDEGLKPFTRHDLAARQHKVYLERFQWPLLAALALLFLEPLIGSRGHTPAAEAPGASMETLAELQSAQSFAALAVLLVFITFPAATQASPVSAEKAYQKGDFARAVKDYAASAQKQPTNVELLFNLGAAAYKAGEFQPAEQSFRNALKTEKLSVQQNAYYNLGNAQYRIGQTTEQVSPQETIKNWQAAVQSYEAALQIKPQDADAKYNRDLVKRKLEQLKEQQQNQQNDRRQNQQAKNGSGQNQNSQQHKPDKNSQQSLNQTSSGQDLQKQQPQQASNSSVGQGKKPENQSQTQTNTGSQPESKPTAQGMPKADAKPDQQQGEQLAEANERREPGQMTKEEAQRLLDSLKGDDAKVDAAPLSPTQSQPRDNPPLKDW
jgi:Ca-activated chloride channel family protein